MAGRDHNDGGGGRGRGRGNDSKPNNGRGQRKRGKGNGPRSGKNTTPNNNRSGDVKSGWKCKTDELKDDTFIWGDGMNDKYSSSRQHFLQFAGKKFTGNEKKSIENGTHTLIGTEKPPVINSQQDFDNLSWNMQRRYDTIEKEYNKAQQKLVNNLSTLYDNLLEACEPVLLEKIKRHANFTFNDPDGVPCAMALMLIIQDLCSSTAGINYAPEMGVSCLYDLLQVDGNTMTLQKYVEVFNERYDACKRMGFKFGTTEIEQKLIADSMAHHGGPYILGHSALQGNIVKRAEEMVVTQIFLRQAGDKYEELRVKFKNDFRILNWNHFPTTVATMAALLENYDPMSDSVQNKVINEINRRKQKNDEKKRQANLDKNDDIDPIPDGHRSGNTDDTTGKSFNQDGTPAEEDKTSTDKDFRPDHPSAASGLSKEQPQRPSALKGGHTGTQRSQQAGNRKSDHNRDTQRPQECSGKKENPNDNNKTNNTKPHNNNNIIR